jgi:MSHA biogenesis protein MshG
MAIYAWRGRNALGEAVSGQLEAMTEGSVAEQLVAGGVVPVQITTSATATDTRSESWLNSANDWLVHISRKPLVVEDILLFSRQMYSLNKAGIPILRALAGLQASAIKPAMVELLKDICSSLDQGRPLSEALARHTKVFGTFYVSMIQVGEMTGQLTKIFLHLHEHLEFERGVGERVKQAMRYPMFVISAMAIAMVVINIFVIPVFAKVFATYSAELPLITRGLLAFSNGMLNWWYVLLPGCIGIVVLTRRYLHTPEGRYRWDTRKLKLPIFGDILLKASLARFARSFALSNQSGVPLGQALTVVAQTVDNAFIGSRIEQMRDGIERGESITHSAIATGIFTPVVLQMIAVGEETGELDDLLLAIADMYERETDYSIKSLSTAIEPLLLVLLGGMVLLLALGVFLPMWSLGDAVMGRGGG